ncbi:unnamed protein product [Cuscuta europaea]|uniref:Auxin-responsive protein n=1 Tax=Cuscuta europaea TaxID=41803 RepID=A0A9P0ZB76_CUSEU|nr:unnamed protein product [Cuscuta europaea]
MDAATLELMDGGGGVVCGGSMSTVSESYSSHPEESNLELGLGLSLGGSGGGGLKKAKVGFWGQYPGRNRILTAEDFPPGVSKTSSCSSSSSSATKASNAFCGSKRAAESSSPPRSGLSQVVGWPPIRTYRINSLVSQPKSPVVEEGFSEKSKNKVIIVDNSSKINNDDAKDKNLAKKKSLFVKVNMDGVLIGRKIDLAAHTNYDNLARTLDDMFFIMPSKNGGPKFATPSDSKNSEEKNGMTEASKLLDGSSEFVLTYEDKEGDWMLVGDVPWEIFVCSVKKLRIARKSEVNGLGLSVCDERNARPMTTTINKPV